MLDEALNVLNDDIISRFCWYKDLPTYTMWCSVLI